MRVRTLVLALALVVSSRALVAQTAADSSAIRTTALDYVEGWYEGNAARMERSLHPELAKRIVQSNERGQSQLGQMGAMTLVRSTCDGGGKDTPAGERKKDVTILDMYQNAASARIDASDWVDYVHLAKWNGRWVIVNVLWELHPRKAP